MATFAGGIGETSNPAPADQSGGRRDLPRLSSFVRDPIAYF